MEKGQLIVIEGASDGIGKSTQLGLLKESLEKEGKEIVTHHFPSYGTYQARPVEEYLKGTFGEEVKEISPYFIHDLYALDRAITWRKELKPQYDLGKTILLDRYTTSSILYQSAQIEDMEEKKDFVDFICDYEYNKLQIQRPDNIIFLHAPFAVIRSLQLGRVENEGIKNDIHERNVELLKKIYDNSMFLADYLKWDMVSCSENDTMLSKEEIHEKVKQLIK